MGFASNKIEIISNNDMIIERKDERELSQTDISGSIRNQRIIVD